MKIWNETNKTRYPTSLYFFLVYKPKYVNYHRIMNNAKVSLVEVNMKRRKYKIYLFEILLDSY